MICSQCLVSKQILNCMIRNCLLLLPAIFIYIFVTTGLTLLLLVLHRVTCITIACASGVTAVEIIATVRHTCEVECGCIEVRATAAKT